jgi:hypothetical protein
MKKRIEDDSALCDLCSNHTSVDDWCDGCGAFVCIECRQVQDPDPDPHYPGHLPQHHLACET